MQQPTYWWRLHTYRKPDSLPNTLDDDAQCKPCIAFECQLSHAPAHTQAAQCPNSPEQCEALYRPLVAMELMYSQRELAEAVIKKLLAQPEVIQLLSEALFYTGEVHQCVTALCHIMVGWRFWMLIDAIGDGGFHMIQCWFPVEQRVWCSPDSWMQLYLVLHACTASWIFIDNNDARGFTCTAFTRHMSCKERKNHSPVTAGLSCALRSRPSGVGAHPCAEHCGQDNLRPGQPPEFLPSHPQAGKAGVLRWEQLGALSVCVYVTLISTQPHAHPFYYGGMLWRFSSGLGLPAGVF